MTIKGGGVLPLASLASLARRMLKTTEHSSQPTPLLAETWELSSLSRLACIPYYEHFGCKIIQCPRTPPLLDVRPRGRNQDKPCVTVLPLASSSGTRKHTAFTRWNPGPRVGTPTPPIDMDTCLLIATTTTFASMFTENAVLPPLLVMVGIRVLGLEHV